MKSDAVKTLPAGSRLSAAGRLLLRGPVFILILVVLLVIGGFANAAFRGARERENIQETAGVEPPTELVGALLLGGFRGIAINLLWLHARNLQDEKKYYEIPAVCELLLTLQPNIPDVWAFHSWNLAYNITVKWQAPEDKWRWVKSGMKVIEKGAERIPNNFLLEHTAGWLYLHKCGDETGDRCAPYYRQRIREETRSDEYPNGRSSFLIAADWFEKAYRSYLQDPHPFVKPYTVYLLRHQAYLQYIVRETLESPAGLVDGALSRYMTRVKDSYLEEAAEPLEKAISTLRDFIREVAVERVPEQYRNLQRLLAIQKDAQQRLAERRKSPPQG